MTVEERTAMVQRKMEQIKRQQLLRENRSKEKETNIELRRKIIIGEMFIEHFPIALQFTPGKSSDEDSQIFKRLDNYMGVLAECQQLYQKMEDVLMQQQ